MPDGAKRIYRRDGKAYPIGSPSLLDKLGGLRAYAYSRHTREPITYHEGKIGMLEPESVIGLHSGLPGLPFTHGIDVDVTRGDPTTTLQHEELHHGLPLLMSDDEHHGIINSALNDDPRVRAAIKTMLPAGADKSLFERIIEMRNKRGEGLMAK